MLEQIPDFPQFRDLGLDLAGEIRPLFRSLRSVLSEFTFANLYLFRRAHAYRVSRLGQLLLVTGRGYDGGAYAFPPVGVGDSEDAALRLCEHLSAQGAEPALFPVPREWTETLFPGPRWRAAADRDQADYVYLREELAMLPGKKFHKRKNRLHQLLRRLEEYSYVPLAEEHVSQCLELAEAWCEIRCSPERPSTVLETAAVMEALRNREILGLRGGVILLEGRVRAFCLGEPLSPDVFVVHFEKVEGGREGLAQLINRDFCLHSLEEFVYVNREQDLGDPGLRQAKQAYHPVCLAEKYRVVPR